MIQTLSGVVNILPVGVVNSGIATPDIFIENVRSRTLYKLSVALIVNMLNVSAVTNVGVPVINPAEFIVIPLGKLPLSNIYVMLTAGDTTEADS